MAKKNLNTGISPDLMGLLKQLGEVGEMTSTYLPQEFRDMLPAFVDIVGQGLASGDLKPELPSFRKPASIGPELVGQAAAVLVKEKLKDEGGETVRISGTIAEITDYDVILKDAACSGVSSVTRLLDGSIVIDREEIIAVQCLAAQKGE